MPQYNSFFPAHIIALTSDRTVDFTLDQDWTGLSEPQKKFLFSQLDFNLPEPVAIRQVHGDKIIIVDEGFLREGHAVREADGLMTRVPLLPLAIRTADCLPVFIYDAKHEGIGLIHAGWQGSRKNIVGKAVHLMQKQWQSDPKDIKVVFGPGIRSCCYEVGEEFREYFPDELIQRDGRDYLDLPKVNQNQFIDSGIQEEHISDYGICTCCDKNYFSNRRENTLAGRMISVMMLRKTK